MVSPVPNAAGPETGIDAPSPVGVTSSASTKPFASLIEHALAHNPGNASANDAAAQSTAKMPRRNPSSQRVPRRVAPDGAACSETNLEDSKDSSDSARPIPKRQPGETPRR